MSLLSKIKSWFSTASRSFDDTLCFYVQCDHCGERLQIRISKRHDLLPDYEGGYTLYKEIMDDKCFKLMYADISFDARYRVISQEISGGHFISEDEYRRSKEIKGGQ